MRDKRRIKINILRKSIPIFLGLTLFLIPINTIEAVSREDELLRQRQYKEQQKESAEKNAAEKAEDANYYKKQVSNLNNQIEETENALVSTESKISKTQEKIEELKLKIITEEDNLAREKNKMNKVVASWYMEGEEGLLEALISSDNLSEMITREQYYDSIKQHVETAMEKIEKLKNELNKQKAQEETEKKELKFTQQEQVSYKKSIESQKFYKNRLLNSSLEDRKEYLYEVANIEQEIAYISSEIYAERQKRLQESGENLIAGSSGYPYGSTTSIDPWGFITRQCTSYAAWYWNSRLGKNWYRGEGPTGTGNAHNWPNLAARNNVGVHSTPQVGAMISWQMSSIMPYGHVAIVEKINGDGTIDVSEFNWIPYAYSYRGNVLPGNYGGYSYIY